MPRYEMQIKDTEKFICSYFDISKNIPDLRQEFNCSTELIRKTAKELGIFPRPNPKDFLNKRLIEYMFVELNKTEEECAKYFNMSKEQFYWYRQQLNIYKRGRWIPLEKKLTKKGK